MPYCFATSCIFFGKLVSHAPDVLVDCRVVPFAAGATPDVLENLSIAEHLTRPAHEQLEKVVLEAGERDQRSSDSHGSSEGIDLQRAERKRSGTDRHAPAQHGAHMRKEIAGDARLQDDVVGAPVQREWTQMREPVGNEHDHRG